MIEAANTSEAGAVGSQTIATMQKKPDGRLSVTSSGVPPTTWTFRHILELGTELPLDSLAPRKEVREYLSQMDGTSILVTGSATLPHSLFANVLPFCPVNSRLDKVQPASGPLSGPLQSGKGNTRSKGILKPDEVQQDRAGQGAVGTQTRVDSDVVASVSGSAEMDLAILSPTVNSVEFTASGRAESNNLVDQLAVTPAHNVHQDVLADTRSGMAIGLTSEPVSRTTKETDKETRRLTLAAGKISELDSGNPAQFHVKATTEPAVLPLKNVLANTHPVSGAAEIVRVVESVSIPVTSGTNHETALHPLGLAHSYGISSEKEAPADLETLIATPTVLEVGVGNGPHGWLRVRAEIGHAGGVTALLVASPLAAEKLHRELPSLSAFLAREQVGIASLEVSTPAKNLHISRTSSSLDFSAGPHSHPDKKPDVWTAPEKEQIKSYVSERKPGEAIGLPSSLVSGRSNIAGELYAAGSGGWLSIRV